MYNYWYKVLEKEIFDEIMKPGISISQYKTDRSECDVVLNCLLAEKTIYYLLVPKIYSSLI